MTADQFPADVPAPKPYEVDAPQISDAALYRSMFFRLAALGFNPTDQKVVGGLQFYVAVMRALNKLEAK